MVELDLSFLSLLALAFAVGVVAGFLLRGLRRRRVEDMLQFFRQRDQEQDRKISNLERDLSDARGRLLALRADQGKNEKASGELRASFEEAQRTIVRLREELAARPPAPVENPEPVAELASEAPAPETAAPAAPAFSSPKGSDAGRKPVKKGRLP